jgi:hypothetical protein
MPFELKRRPKALSYSGWAMFEKNPEEFYLKYLAGTKAPSLPQESYMSIGSAFDARVKADLHSAVFGPGSDPAFSFEKLFEDQVEPHNRDWALGECQYVADAYKYSGSYDELLNLLLKAIEPPRFESKIDATIDGVPFTGKPDLRFKVQFPDYEPLRIVLDWKVKSYCSKHGASPSKGYAMCRDGYDFRPLKLNATKKAPDGKPSASHGTEHDNYLAYNHRGLTINAGYMETCNDEYADQVSTYGWMLGEKPGDEDVVVWIDEIPAKYMGEGKRPLLRVANHRARVSRDYQLKLLEKIKKCWNAITTGHIFVDMPRADSDSRCEVLEEMSVGLQTDGSSEENWFNEAVRPQFKR